MKGKRSKLSKTIKPSLIRLQPRLTNTWVPSKNPLGLEIEEIELDFLKTPDGKRRRPGIPGSAGVHIRSSRTGISFDFTLYVYTQKIISEMLDEFPLIFPEFGVILKEESTSEVREFVEGVLEFCTVESLDETIDNLRRYFLYEYDKYEVAHAYYRHIKKRG